MRSPKLSDMRHSDQRNGQHLHIYYHHWIVPSSLHLLHIHFNFPYSYHNHDDGHDI